MYKSIIILYLLHRLILHLGRKAINHYFCFMEDLFLIFDVMAVFQGVILGILLLFLKQNGKSSFFLGLFLITYSLEFIPSLVFSIWDNIPQYYSYLPLYFYFLNLPFLYIYCRKLIDKISNKTILYLIIPGIIEFIFILTIFFGFKSENLFISQNNNKLFNAYQLIAIIYSIVIAIYTRNLIINYRKKAANFYSRINGKILRWLINLVSFLIIYDIILILFIGLSYYSDTEYTFITHILSIINVFFIYWVALSGYKQSYQPMIILAQKDDELEINQDDNNSIIFSQIVEYFKEAKPYTNPDLNIQLLAQKINISYKKISSSIKESTNENFNTFVNKYRVEEVKLMLSSEKYKDYSIEALGYEAGFNSKACFYTAFKKFTEKTPTSYRKDINT